MAKKQPPDPTNTSERSPVGPKGDQGPAGQNGHTNVTAYNFTTSSSSWNYTSPAWNVGRMANPDLDLRDYQAVKKRFNLKD